MRIRSFVRANHKIRVPNVRCIGATGEMLGVLSTRDALRMALDAGLDLVEISPNAEPPVCRIMDFGKFRYEEGRKERQARRKHTSQVVKEVKFHANVAEHDYETKVNHVRKFLEKGFKVKVSLQFRGRENAHRELGFEVVGRVLRDCAEVAAVDMEPKLVGRNIIAMLSNKPTKAKPRPAAGTPAEAPAPAAAAAPEKVSLDS